MDLRNTRLTHVLVGLQLLGLLLNYQPKVVNRPFPGRTRRDSSDNIVVVHYDSGSSVASTLRYLRRHGDAYHYLIDRHGTIIKLIDPRWEARHAGISEFDGHWNVNHYSIGVCLLGTGLVPFSNNQYKSLAWLVRKLEKRYPDITEDKIVGHSDVAWPLGRKHDPGSNFAWELFRQLLRGDSQVPPNPLTRRLR